MRDVVKEALKGTVIDIETSSEATLTAQVSKCTENGHAGEEVTLIATDGTGEEMREVIVTLSPHMARQLAKRLKSLADTIGEEPYTVTDVQGKAEGDDFELRILADNGDRTIAATMSGGAARTLAKMVKELDGRCQ